MSPLEYVRMPIEAESPEELGYDTIECNLSESSVSDTSLQSLGIDIGDLDLAYTGHRGRADLRAALATELGVDSDHVLITAGASFALFALHTALLDVGTQAVVVSPNYATNLETPRLLGADIARVALRFEDRYALDVDQVESLITKDTALVSVTYPHNPTGTQIPFDDLRRLVDISESVGARLLVDETYRQAAETPLPGAASLGEHVVAVSSLSKAYGLPGIRIGWITTRDTELMTALLAAKEQIAICNSVLDEAVAAHVVTRGVGHTGPLREAMFRRRDIVAEWMTTEPRLEWVPPAAGVVCFPRIRREVEVDVPRFYDSLLQRHRTYVGPGHWFDQDDRHMRIGFAWPSDEQLREGLRRVSRALDGAGERGA